MQTPEQLDRLLAAGTPAGPELDRLWVSLEARRAAADSVAATARKPWGWWWALSSLATAAAVLPWWFNTSIPAWSSRGVAANLELRLEASCGQTPACRVGETITLKVTRLSGTGPVAVFLEGNPRVPLVTGLELLPSVAVVVPATLAAELSDMEAGLTLTASSAGASGGDSVLHLKVIP